MKLTYYLICLFLVHSVTLNAQQNLIPNPDFEEYYGCDYDWNSSLLQEVMPHWTSRVTTPHFFHDSCVNLAHEPYNGSAYIYGINVMQTHPDTHPFQRREYPQIELLDSLYSGRNYYLEYYTRVTYPDESPCSSHGVYFSDTVILDAENPQPPGFSPLILEPQLEIDTIFGSHEKWERAWFCYTPDQNYSVATFGNFRSRDSVDYSFASFGPLYSYDAFYLIEIPDTLSLSVAPETDTICAGDCVTLASNHSRVPANFTWDLPGSDLLTSNDSVVTVCYEQPGVYSIGLSANHCHGNYDRVWAEAITVLPRPEPNPTVQNFQIPAGENLQLEICDNSANWAITWSPNPGLSCLDCPSPVFSGIASARLTAEISANGVCVDTCLYNIEVLELAVADFKVAVPTICQGDCFQFINESLNLSGPIRFGTPEDLQTLPSGVENFEFCPDTPGDYELMFIVEGDLNFDTLIIADLLVDPLPTPLQVPRNFIASVGEIITLPAGFNARQYHWQVLDGELDLNCANCATAQVDPFVSGDIQLTVSNGTCSDSLLYNIEVARQEAQLYLPTAFSPNFDGINDEFRAYGNFFTVTELEIYDRYGGLMYQESGPTASWDGLAGDRQVVAGVYVYILRYTNIYGEELMKSGAVTLVP